MVSAVQRGEHIYQRVTVLHNYMSMPLLSMCATIINLCTITHQLSPQPERAGSWWAVMQ